MRSSRPFLTALVIGLGLSACGDGPSLFFRQGRFPITNFPVYVSVRGTVANTGTVQKCGRKGLSPGVDDCDTIATALSSPEGIATDTFKNIYVIETGTSNLLKMNKEGKNRKIFATGLSSPTFVAVDNFDEVYVSQGGATNNIIRARDGEVLASFSDSPTSFAFGLDNRIAICFKVAGSVQFGIGAGAETIPFTDPNGIAVDYSGRYYISEDGGAGRILRYSQKSALNPRTIATGLTAPAGLAIDPAENLLYVQQSFGLVRSVSFDGVADPNAYAQGLDDPYYLAFEKY